jgi:hypothetical protein
VLLMRLSGLGRLAVPSSSNEIEVGVSSDQAYDSSDIEQRREMANLLVRHALMQAEERYLVVPGATLGTWFARVHETVAVASRITVARLEEDQDLLEEDVAVEQLGLQADICAEAIRAVAEVWPGGSTPEAKDELLEFVSFEWGGGMHMSWTTLLLTLARCSAALEPVANGLRDKDLPMDSSAENEAIVESFHDAAVHAFAAVCALSSCAQDG